MRDVMGKGKMVLKGKEGRLVRGNYVGVSR